MQSMKMLHCRFWFSDQSVLNIEWWDEQRVGLGGVGQFGEGLKRDLTNMI